MLHILYVVEGDYLGEEKKFLKSGIVKKGLYISSETLGD